MSEFMPHYAPVVVLLFLGTVLLMGASFLVLFYGAARRSSFFARLGGGAALTIAAGYFATHYAAPTWRVLHHGFRLRCPQGCSRAPALHHGGPPRNPAGHRARKQPLSQEDLLGG